MRDEVFVDFQVRWYQQNFWNALTKRTHSRLMTVWPRRTGKDEIVLRAMCKLAAKEVGTYWHCFPEQKQARKAIWNGINPQTSQRRILDIFHPLTIKRMQDQDMFIELRNGSTFQLIGSDNYDSTVGSGPRGIAYSEWALSNPQAWAYHSPMIRESQGWAAFITTPRGFANHAATMFDRASNSDKWFSELLTIEDTRTLTSEEQAEALDEYQALHGIDQGRAIYEQEYMCSFSGGAMVGAYFGAEMARAELNGQMQQEVPIDPAHPVHCVMDLGRARNNPVWLFQVFGKGQPLKIVDFYLPASEDLDDWIKDLRDMGFDGNCLVPHDIMVTEWGSNKTRIERLRARNMHPIRIPRVSVADGLQAGRTAINNAAFHSGTDDRSKRVAQGIAGLQSYRREWDAVLKTFKDAALKDWAEHIGSAWRYLGLGWREHKPVHKQTKPTHLVYEVKPDGRIVANMSVREAVEAKMKRLRGQE